MKKVFISCGETSGDRYAAEIIKSFLPNKMIEFYGNGGQFMRDAGVKVQFDVVDKSSIGFIEPLTKIPYFLYVLKQTKKVIKKKAMDVVIIIDHQGFNIPLAKWCKKNNIHIISFIAPQFWMWGNKKAAKKFVNYCSHIFCIFEREFEYYQRIAPTKVTRVDHPLLSMLPNRKCSTKTIVGIFPGSRKQEIDYCLPVMINVIDALEKKYDHLEFKIAIASNKIQKLIKKHLNGRNLELENDARKLICEAKCSLVASGTVSLEHAIIGTPCVAIYKLSQISYFIASKLVLKKLRKSCFGFIALPNILAETKVCPEFLQSKVTVANIEPALQKLLFNSHEYETVISGFKSIQSKLTVNRPPFKAIFDYLNKSS